MKIKAEYGAIPDGPQKNHNQPLARPLSKRRLKLKSRVTASPRMNADGPKKLRFVPYAPLQFSIPILGSSITRLDNLWANTGDMNSLVQTRLCKGRAVAVLVLIIGLATSGVISSA